ncbi:MAG: trypsin-like peptidase domain-containing protein [Dehalococcoidia bacterium]|nr:trypsin-like peptidase domain-containing protein [Dehalococcoidia bacterium]
MKFSVATALILAAMLLFSACRIEFSTTPISTPSPEPVIREVVPLDPGWKSPGPEENAAVLPNIADVVEKGYPGVVTITTEQIVNDMFSRSLLQSGAGSGWILDGSGIIVTNNHVVEGARKVVVQFSDGRTSEVTADRVFRDPLTDLAIIKVDLTDLPTVSIGDSGKLRVGDWVVAIGNPLGKGIKAKEGIVSGLKVSLSLDEDESLYDLIETSAAINEGNSGGPLLNMKGEVIGITSAKIAKIGVEGMGYAISINSSLPILQELVNKGYITRPFLGVELYTVNDYVAYYNGLSVKRGAIITTVQPGSPAARAGMRRLDVIIRYQGKEITTAPELLRELRSSKIGDEISVTYIRGKNTYNVTALLTDSPPPR